MKTFTIARVISMAKNSHRAMVTIMVGEGKSRQSVTRHIERKGGVWVGNNPDPTAAKQRELAERTVLQASGKVVWLESRVALFGPFAENGVRTNEELDELIRILPATSDELDRGKVAKGAKEIAREMVRAIRVRLDKASSDLKESRESRAKTLDEFPITVSFVGEGL